MQYPDKFLGNGLQGAEQGAERDERVDLEQEGGYRALFPPPQRGPLIRPEQRELIADHIADEATFRERMIEAGLPVEGK